jgi:hypothetical protein
MRSPLLVFFSGYRINRYLIKLKMPRDFSVTKSLAQNRKLRSGTCLWRGLYARWNLVSQTHTLLDFSQVKQYRMGFDSTLPRYKSTHRLMEYRSIKFNLTYVNIVRDHIFYNFFYNHGTYSTTSNHNLALWYPVYSQIYALSKILQTKKKAVTRNIALELDKSPWLVSWPQDALIWSFLVSQKSGVAVPQGYLTDAIVEEYDEFFYMLSAWEHTPITPHTHQEYWVDSESDTYILPEFLGHRDVALSNVTSNVEDDATVVYSNHNLIKLLEDIFFKKADTLKYKSQASHRLSTFFTLLALFLVNE